MSKIAFISGHLDLTSDEFEAHYQPQLDKALHAGYSFVIGDARGADTAAQSYLFVNLSFAEYRQRVTVFHMLTSPRNHLGHCPLRGGYPSNNAKDRAMTEASDFDIAWVRPNKYEDVSGRMSGTEQNIVRRKAKHMNEGRG